jgi:hypothetical protein
MNLSLPKNFQRPPKWLVRVDRSYWFRLVLPFARGVADFTTALPVYASVTTALAKNRHGTGDYRWQDMAYGTCNVATYLHPTGSQGGKPVFPISTRSRPKQDAAS